jgi:2-polyprenyl-3-methyl-5-hydroxy-6-metoxy-1,4-benzoquinol methylase
MKIPKIIPFVPKSSDYSNYADKNYWLERYENSKNSCEWYEDYETIKPLINELNISKRSVILHVGIGNSEFSEKMYDDGYKKCYNIDFARNVIHYMKLRNKRIRSSMIFETMNVLDIEYEDEQFDIIFDKATFDCVLCDIGAEKKAKIFMSEIYRLLKYKGYYFMISNTEPEKRIKYLQNSEMKFNITVHKIENDEEDVKNYNILDYNMNYLKKTHYIYICQKMEEGNNKNFKESVVDNEEEDEKNESKEEIKRKKESVDNGKSKKSKLDMESSISYIKLEEFQKTDVSIKTKDLLSIKPNNI